MVKLFLVLLLVFSTAYADIVINESGFPTQSFRVESDNYDSAIAVSANTDYVYILRNNDGTAIVSINTDGMTVSGEINLQNTFASVYRSVDGTIDNSLDTRVTFDTVVSDTKAIFDGTSTFNIAVAGTYLINGSALFDDNATNRRVLKININGTDAAETGIPGTVQSNASILNISLIRYMSVGDALSFVVFQNSGAGLALKGGQTFTYAQLVRLF